MKKRLILFYLLGSLVLINACQKEKSFEGGSTPSEGTLQDDVSGDCLPKTVAGAYVVGTALTGTTNYIEVQIDVTKTGSYTIYTDTVNGIYFRVTGIFTTLGLNTVQLKGSGTPVAPGISNFIVSYGLSECSVAVTTSGTLGSFTLDGAPGGCMGAVPSGTYTAGTTLTATNTVAINVNVTAIGAYTLSSTLSNGITFTGSGVFTTTGPQAITLTGTGTPATSGITNIPVVSGSSTCNFNIDVLGGVAAATFTVDCATAVVNGTYTQNAALVAATNTVSIAVNVTTAGTYTISTTTTNGMTFSASGTFTATGVQTVTLAGAGTPTIAGANTIPVVGASCNFSVTVVAASGGAAIFTVNCGTAVVNGTYTQTTALTASNTVVLSVNVTTAGTYNVTTTATNGMTFTSGAGTWAAGAQTLTLTGSGTPNASGTIYIPVIAGTTPCNFLILVGAPATASDYFPRTTNSNWSYQFDGVATDSLLRKVISPTFTALGNTYNIFMHDDGSGLDSSGYYRKNGGDYLEYLDVGGFIGYDNPLRAEYTMLKDNVPILTNWKSAGFSGSVTGTPLTLRFSYTVLQKDVTVTVGAITYQNVIVVEEKFEQFTGGVWVDVTSLIDFYGKSYYARNVGLIKFEALDAANAVTGRQELRRYIVF